MKKLFLSLILLFSLSSAFAQNSSIWQRIENESSITSERVREEPYSLNQKLYSFNARLFGTIIANANDVTSRKQGVTIELPNMNGELEQFMIWESSNFEPRLQAQYPDIRAYAGKGITDPNAIVNLSFAPIGLQTMVFRAGNGTEFIESYTKDNAAYILFDSKTRIRGNLPFECSTVDQGITQDLLQNKAVKANNKFFKTLRLALSCTAEYSFYYGGTVNGALAGMNATMTRVNGIYNKDLAVKLLIIDNNSAIVFTNAATDGYSPVIGNQAPEAWHDELKANLDKYIGSDNYDIGHLFGRTGGGGNAGCIGCVCDNPSSNAPWGKGGAYTSPGNGIPQGDYFDIDFVAHEMGHQLGAYHTFTFNYEGSAAQVEPGSGSTIMGYAGVAGFDNGVALDVQSHSDDYFTYISVKQIQDNLLLKSCPISYPMTNPDSPYYNNTPTADAGGDYTIPKGTPFMLVGTASDADANDVLTHCWEQSDLGSSSFQGASSIVSQTKISGPNFRSFYPSDKNVRYMPKMSSVLYNQLYTSDFWESLYLDGNKGRTFNFSYTVRDNHPSGGQTNTDKMKVVVDGTKGPFIVTSQNTVNTSYAGGSNVDITWFKGNSDTLPGASTVDVLLSTNAVDDDAVFTTIATGLPNNENATITLPSFSATYNNCRFMVKASGNIFFAVNSQGFKITPGSLAVGDFEFNNFALYPNPNNGDFTIRFDNPVGEQINVMVHDIRGRKIFENNYSNQANFNQNIQLNHTEAGIYLISVTDGDRKIVKRIIIK